MCLINNADYIWYFCIFLLIRIIFFNRRLQFKWAKGKVVCHATFNDDPDDDVANDCQHYDDQVV